MSSLFKIIVCGFCVGYQSRIPHCRNSKSPKSCVALRFILSNYHRTSSVTAMILSFLYHCSTIRRDYFGCVVFTKHTSQNPTLKQQLLSPPSYISARIDHQHKVNVLSCHTMHFHESFIPSNCVRWNRLPSSVAGITDETFRSAVSNLLWFMLILAPLISACICAAAFLFPLHGMWLTPLCNALYALRVTNLN